MLLSLLFGGLLLRCDPDSVTYSSVAKSVAVALTEISAASGLHLSAEPEAGREIVLINVDHLPTNTFMADLARVTSCNWSQEGDRWILRTDQAVRNQQAEREFEKRRDQIAKDLTKRIADLDRKPPANSGEGGAVTSDPELFMSADPGQRAILTLLKEVDPGDLAAADEGGRVVWASNAATSVQKPLGDDAVSIIKDWIAAHNQQMADVPLDQGNEQDQVQQLMPKEVLDMIKRSSSPVKEPPAKALLIAKQFPFMGGLQLDLVVYNAQGTPLLQANTMLGSSMIQELTAGLAEKAAKSAAPQTPPSASTKIEYSPDSLALMKLSAGANSNPFALSVPASIRQKLLRPDLTDPLSYMATDALKAVAAHQNEQLIADLPDSALGLQEMMGLSDGQPKTVEEAEAALKSGKSMTMSSSDGVMLIGPSEPDKERRNRLDRGSMAQLLAQTEKKMQPSLDDLCAFAVDNVSPMSNPISMLYVGLFVPSLVGFEVGGLTDWNMMRLYGSLDEAQRETLRNNGRVPFGAMSDTQLGFVRQLLFDTGGRLRPANKPVESTDIVSQMIVSFSGMGGSGLLEPTEVMPNGVPAAGYLTCSTSTEPALLLQGIDGGRGTWCLGPQELAMLKMVSEAPGVPGDFHLPDKALLGSRANLAFVFHVSETACMDERLSDSSFADDASTVSLSALPGDVQALVDQQLQALKKSPLGAIQSLPMFRTQPPP